MENKEIIVAWVNDKTNRKGATVVMAPDETSAKLIWRKDHPKSEGWNWCTTWFK